MPGAAATATDARAEELHELRVQHYRLLRQQEARLLSRSFTAYVRAAWPVLETHGPLIWNWHYDLLCEWLELAARRDPLARKLIINVPPRTLKSTICTVLWPTWVWTRDPSARWMFISYAKGLALFHSVQRRNLIQSEWYQDRWTTMLAEDQNQKGQYDNQSGGRMFSTSVEADIGGRGGSFLVFDDPNDPLNPESDAERGNAISKCDTALSTRLDDPLTGVRLVIQQRTHQGDVTGHLMEQEPESWTRIRLPMEAEETERIIYPISGREHVREPGEVLMPERFPPWIIAEMRLTLGSHGAAAQLQQNPSSTDGGMIQRKWWKFYKVLPAKLSAQIQSWDLSFKDAKASDYVVGQVWAKNGSAVYLCDQVRDRMDFPTTRRAFRALTAKWPDAMAKMVEDKANGPAIIADLTNEIGGIIAFTPKDSKEARLATVCPAIEAGNVYLPDPSIAPWVHDFIEECAVFPNGVHDDQVDAMSQALLRLIGPGVGQTMFGRGDDSRLKVADFRAF